MKFNKFKKFINNSLSNEIYLSNLTKINLILAILSSIFIVMIFIDIKETINVKYSLNMSEIILLILNYSLGIKIWQKFSLNNFGDDFGNNYSHWAFSRIGRYIPGGLAVLSMRISEKIPKEKKKSMQLFGILEEQFLGPLIITLTFLIFYLLIPDVNVSTLFFVFILIFVLFRFVYLKIVKNSKSILLSPVLVIAHILSFFVFLFVISKNLGVENAHITAAYYQFSTSLSLFFVGVPAGLGIREMIYYFLSVDLVSEGILFLILFQTRINILICDIIFGFIGFYNIYIKKKN